MAVPKCMLADAGDAYVYDFSTNNVPGQDERERGYWRDVGTLDAYYDSHMDLVSVDPVFNLYNMEWPILTWQEALPPAKFVFDEEGRRGTALQSLVSMGCIVSGSRVERSILSPGARVPALCTGLREYFRDIYDHLLRLNQTIESIRDSVATATSVNLSMISLQENETMKRLAAYAALIAVPTMIAGIYGMNFEHMPELGWKFGYGGALAVMTVIDVYLFYRLRKAKWL